MLAWWEVLLRLLAAAALSGVIGANRERRDWAAGLRTHMLVSVGAALVIIVSMFGFGDVVGTPGMRLDPSRLAAQVISGIGFLGAGTILFKQRAEVVRGLTTAAGLWSVAAIGLAAGAGLYVVAALGTAVAWVILAVLKPLERRLFSARNPRPRLTLRMHGSGALACVEHALLERGLPLHRLEMHGNADGADELAVLFECEVDFARLSELADALREVQSLRVERIDITPGE